MGDVRIFGLVLVTHIVLLLLVAGEDADFFDVGGQETLQDGVSEGSSAATNQEDFVFENGHNIIYSYQNIIKD